LEQTILVAQALRALICRVTTTTTTFFLIVVGTMAVLRSLCQRQRGAPTGALVSIKAEEYRRKAALCERMAQQAHDPKAKRELEELVRGWLLLVEHAERASRMVQFVSRRTDGD
jgi:hypothetical protein